MLSVDLVEGSLVNYSGIGRYSELLKRLTAGIINMSSVHTQTIPRLFGKGAFLEYIPTRVISTLERDITHFPRIMGCAVNIWQKLGLTVATVHDLGPLVCEADLQLWNTFDFNIFKLQIAGLKKIDFFMVNSDQTRLHLNHFLKIENDRIFTVNLGIDLDIFKRQDDPWEMLSKVYNIYPEEYFNVIYVGNEQPRKNMRTLLESVAQVKHQGIPIRIIKVGGAGGLRWRGQTLEVLKQFNLKDNIVLPGFVPDEHLPYFYSASHVYVCTTLLEGGFNWPCMESLACGTPVIASKAALIPPDICPAAITVENNTASCFAEHIVNLYNNSGAWEARSKHAVKAIQPYNLNNTAEQLIQVYHKVANNQWC